MKKNDELKPKFELHRIVATQLEAIYIEINKLATKKPTEKITTLVSKKINHIIVKVRELVFNDDFLDAIETVPVDGSLIRLDETLIILGELKSILDRQWFSQEFVEYRGSNGFNSLRQIIR